MYKCYTKLYSAYWIYILGKSNNVFAYKQYYTSYSFA